MERLPLAVPVKTTMLVLLLVFANLADAEVSAPPDLAWMHGAKITAFRLAGYGVEDSSAQKFHGIAIREVHQLDPDTSRELVSLLIDVANRRFHDEQEAELKGQVTGGVWGCISGGQGLRFELGGEAYDFIVECRLWIKPAEKTASGRGAIGFVFTQEEGEHFNSILQPIFRGVLSQGVEPPTNP